MPSNSLVTRSYGTSLNTIFAGDKPEAAQVATIDTSFVQADADGNQIILPGYPVLDLSTGFARIYPYATLQTAITATTDTAVVVNEAQFYKVGDVLTVARPYATLTLALTWADADTLTILFDGQSIAHVVASFTSLTALATAIAATYNANPYFARRAQAIASGAVVYIFARDANNYSLSVSGDGSAGNGTYTANTATLRSDVTVGTITTSGINTATNTLTLASATAVTLPVGAPLAIAVNRSMILGITGYSYLVGTTQTELTPESNDIPVYYSAEVYRARLAVSDLWLTQLLPELKLVPRNV